MGDCFGRGTDCHDGLAPHCNGNGDDRIDVGAPIEVRLDTDESDDIALQLAVRAGDAAPLENEVVGRPDDVADTVVDGDVWTLLREVVERVGID